MHDALGLLLPLAACTSTPLPWPHFACCPYPQCSFVAKSRTRLHFFLTRRCPCPAAGREGMNDRVRVRPRTVSTQRRFAYIVRSTRPGLLTPADTAHRRRGRVNAVHTGGMLCRHAQAGALLFDGASTSLPIAGWPLNRFYHEAPRRCSDGPWAMTMSLTVRAKRAAPQKVGGNWRQGRDGEQ
jgi:hypothetical protein